MFEDSLAGPWGNAGMRLRRLLQLSDGLLFQNAVLFAGGAVAGLGGFIYHSIAGHVLGPAVYGKVAYLVSLYSMGAAISIVISVLMTRRAAGLVGSDGLASVRFALVRALRFVGILGILAVSAITVASSSIAEFGHLTGRGPVVVLAVCIATGWAIAVPRGVLQGLQRFVALSFNLSVEPVTRVSALVVFLVAGFAIAGTMLAFLTGLMIGLILSAFQLRDLLRAGGYNLRSSSFAASSIAAIAGVVGIQLLFNQDVALSEHFLPSHQGGIYAGVNKIGTVVFYLTLSVGQVLLPRVVDAANRRQAVDRLLAASVGIVVGLGSLAIATFALIPGVVVDVLYGAGFADATPYVVLAGCIGLCLSLVNLFVQFFIGVHDQAFVVLLAVGCIAEPLLIAVFHASVRQVLIDVVIVLLGLVTTLSLRSLSSLRLLRAESR